MATAERTAHTASADTPTGGYGTVRATTGAWDTLPMTQVSGTGRADADAGMEELAAAARSTCFAMALALRLDDHELTPEELSITATVTRHEVDGVPTIRSARLRVRGRMPVADRTAFQAAVDEATTLCSLSQLFAGSTISVDTEIESV